VSVACASSSTSGRGGHAIWDPGAEVADDGGGQRAVARAPARTILTALGLESSSVVALQRAYALAHVFSARLCVIHAIPAVAPPLVECEEVTRRAVIRWAGRNAKVILRERDVLVDLGAPGPAIAAAAGALKADLVVVGEGTNAGSNPAAEHLASSLHHALLVARSPNAGRELVAATDLRDASFTVVRTATRLAAALDAHVTLVHNLGPEPSSAAKRAGVRRRMRTLERLAQISERVHRAHVGVLEPTANTIARVARERSADIALVGVRPGHGETLRAVLALASCSVLAVPLPRI
jgi:nucleotide-binding universal stress UspA family protein